MKLEIKKFKKHTDLNVPFPAFIEGDNGTGKTTIHEAFLWCLNQKDSNLKEFTSANVYDKNLSEKERFAEVAFHGNGIIFRKRAQPLYSRERGTDDEKLKTELNCEYLINESPVGLREYNDKISEICNGFELALFTNPLYFLNLPQKDKLKIISHVVDCHLQDFVKELPNKSVLRAEMLEQRKEIDELETKNKGLLETFPTPPPAQRNTEEIENLKMEIAALQLEEKSAVPDSVLQENERLRQYIREFEMSVFKPKPNFEFVPKQKQPLKNLKDHVRNSQLDTLLIRYNSEKARCERIKESNTAKESEIQSVSNSISDYAVKDYICNVCPQCSHECEKIQRAMSKEDAMIQIDAKVQRLSAELEKLKEDDRLAVATMFATAKEGQELAAKDKERNAQIDIENAQIVKDNEAIQAANDKLNDDNIAEMEAVKLANVEVLKENQANVLLFEDKRAKDIAELKSKIVTDFKSVDNSEKISAFQGKIDILATNDKELDEQLAGYNTAQTQIKSNEERAAKVRKSLIENERLMIQIEQAENSYRTECDKRINEFLPDGVNITLFRKLITQDGFEEVAIITIDGFEHPNTSRANSRLSLLCQRFQEHFGVKLPIFYDNAENLTNRANLPKVDYLVELRAVINSPLIILEAQ